MGADFVAEIGITDPTALEEYRALVLADGGAGQ